MNPKTPHPKKGSFYNLDRIKQIPIESVSAQMLGLPIERRGGNLWCKARPEEKASTILHLDRNLFYDFGTNEYGDVIHFVSYVLGISWKEALDRLAESYHIPPENRREGLHKDDLSLWEYEKIGISGDLATKNFEYGEYLSTDKMEELFAKYAMPMRELRQKHPKTYERILRQKAIPYVASLQKDFFLDVWQKHLLVEDLGSPELFYSGEISEELKKQGKELAASERLMARAAKGTSIQCKSFGPYEPEKVLTLLKTGDLCPNLGSIDRKGLQMRSKRKNSPIKAYATDCRSYILAGPDDLPHSAYLKFGQVIVEYLEEDEAKLALFLQKIKGETPSLDNQITLVEKRQHSLKTSSPVFDFER